MRAAVSLAVLVMLTGVACGPKSSPEESAATITFPAVACSTLTEAEVAQFMKSLPTFRSALKAAKWTPTPPPPDADPVASLTALVEGMEVPGMGESLKAFGSDWGAFRATLYKVFVASAALSIQRLGPEQTAQMKQDTTESGKEIYANFQILKGACAALPPANLELVKTHPQDLQPLGVLGR